MENKTILIFSIIAIVCGVISVSIFIYQLNHDCQKEEERLCSIIKATPAWFDSGGSLMGYGVLQQIEGENLVEELIQQNLQFVYTMNCNACKKQIEYFGTDWEKYMKSGLTIDCSKNIN